jgi:hypothetical protein
MPQTQAIMQTTSLFIPFRRGGSMMRFRTLAAAAALVTLSACATDQGRPTVMSQPAWDTHARAHIDDKLGESSRRAATALETLAMIQRTRTEPPASSIDETLLPPELARQATVEWNGPAHELVQQVARNIGYAFMVQGNPPPIPPMVSVSAVDLPVAKILETTSLQVVSFATINVDPNAKRIEFRYDREPRGHQAEPQQGRQGQRRDGRAGK